MVALLLVLVLLVVFLWSVSLGAVLEVRKEAQRDLATACRAWVPLAGRDDQLYRCGVPLRPGQSWCGTHASPRDRRAGARDPGVERVEATRQWADARAKLQWGIPVASIVLLGAVAAVLALLA